MDLSLKQWKPKTDEDTLIGSLIDRLKIFSGKARNKIAVFVSRLKLRLQADFNILFNLPLPDIQIQLLSPSSLKIHNDVFIFATQHWTNVTNY